MDNNTLLEIKNNFIKELAEAEVGEKNSLAFIINQIPQQPLVKSGEVFQVLTIGGSVCRKALVKKNGAQLEIVSQEDTTLKVLETKQDFLDCVMELLDPEVKVLAINFAYPLEPVFEDGKLDGVLMRGAKEHQFTGLVGQRVGKEIEKYVKEHSDRKDFKVSVANDTVCLLLSGLTQVSWDSLAAGIVGTGINFAIFLDKDKLVNLEAANFDKLLQTPEGKQIDEESVSPGMQRLEKEVAGGYLFKHFNLMVKNAGLEYPEISSTKEVDEAISSDSPQIVEIAKLVNTSSAQLVGCVVAALMEYRKTNLTFVMEGSLFWKGIDYKSTVAAVTKQLSVSFSANFVHIDDSTVLGGAQLVV